MRHLDYRLPVGCVNGEDVSDIEYVELRVPPVSYATLPPSRISNTRKFRGHALPQ
jgi:hypothetical protein